MEAKRVKVNLPNGHFDQAVQLLKEAGVGIECENRNRSFIAIQSDMQEQVQMILQEGGITEHTFTEDTQFEPEKT